MSMPRMMRRAGDAETAPAETRAGQILSRLRTIAQRAWDSYPEALRLEADVVAAVDERLNGERRLHRGIRSEAVWSDVLDAERRMHLFDLLRLASSHRPRALAAFDAALDILAAGRGKKVVDLEPQVVDAATAVDHALRASAELTSVHVMATSPNGPGGTAYTLDEARELRLKARELKEAADEADMAARRAEIQCVPAGLRDGGGR